MSSNCEILAFGEILWDILSSGKVLGGAPGNFAYRVAQEGYKVGLASRIGSDNLGREISSTLDSKNIPLDNIQVDSSKPTGTVDVTLSSKGHASYVINPNVAYDYIEATEQLVRAAEQARLICFGTLIQRSPVSRSTLFEIINASPKSLKLLDINLRKDCFTFDTVERSLQTANILKLNDDEVNVVSDLLKLEVKDFDGFTKTLFSQFTPDICLITLGDKGAIGYTRDGSFVSLSGYNVKVVDTIGSGDAFTAGFTSKFLKGCSLEESCDYGNRLGATVAAHKGGMSPVNVSKLNEYLVPPEIRA